MAEIIQINHETLLDFVKRQGEVSTTEVEHRFGWSNERASRSLHSLAHGGLIVKLGRGPREGGGAVNIWKPK